MSKHDKTRDQTSRAASATRAPQKKSGGGTLLGRDRGDIPAIELDAAGAPSGHADNAVEQRRLAGAVAAEQRQ